MWQERIEEGDEIEMQIESEEEEEEEEEEEGEEEDKRGEERPEEEEDQEAREAKDNTQVMQCNAMQKFSWNHWHSLSEDTWFLSLKDNNKFICCSQTQQYFII
jgi:hypothetical protein